MLERGQWLIASAVVGLGFALACGGSTPATPTPAAPVEPTPEAGTPAPKAPAVKPGIAGIKERGALKVAADPDAPPFLSKNDQGKLEGFEYAIMAAIADRAGVPVSIVAAPFPDLPGKLTSGEADVIIGQMSPASSYDGIAFSTSYLQYSMCLIVPTKSTAKNLADLRGKKIGMYDDPVAKQLSDVLVGGSYEPVLFDDYGYFEMLVRGQLDAMVYDCPLARYEMKIFGDQLRVVDDALNVATYNVGVRADDPMLLGEVNAVLKDIGDSGLLAKVEQTWLGDVVPKDDYETATGRVVLVRRGDTLGMVAERELGSKDRWKDIYAANKDVIGTNPDLIYVGMRLRIDKGAKASPGPKK